MTLIEEGLLALRGCWRLLRRDPAAYEDFNVTIDGFWRSFAMVLPLLLLAYPLFVLGQRYDVALAATRGVDPPILNLGLDYFLLLMSIVVWPIVAALLAWLMGTGRTYVRYMIIYNWVSLPVTAIATIPYFLHLLTGTMWVADITSFAVFLLVLYVSWQVAKLGLHTSAPVASAFVLADYALSYGFGALAH